MAVVLRHNAIDHEIEYAFEIKLLGLPAQASAFLGRIASTQDGASAGRLKSADRPCAKLKAFRNVVTASSCQSALSQAWPAQP
jgi:hypothetical protein